MFSFISGFSSALKAVLITIIIMTIPLGIVTFLANKYHGMYVSKVEELATSTQQNKQLQSDIDTQNESISKMEKETSDRITYVKTLQSKASVLAKKNESLAKQLIELGNAIPHTSGEPTSLEECRKVEQLLDDYIKGRQS